MFGKDSITGLSGMQAQIIGCTLCLITSWCYASVVVFTRIMQRIPAFVLNTYYSCVAAFATAVIIFIESQRNGGELRIFTYTKDQYIASLGCSFINVVGMTCQTIALQNEKSGLITLLGYVSLVYAFMFDTLIFNETIFAQEGFGIGIIFVLNIILVCR